MNLIPEIEAAHDEIKALRRTIHAHPEFGMKKPARQNWSPKISNDGAWKCIAAWEKPAWWGCLNADP